MVQKKVIPWVTASSCEYFRVAEERAVRIRKLLSREDCSWDPGLRAYASNLAKMIETLSRQGQKADAASAAEIVEVLELLLDELHNGLGALLDA